MAADDSEPGGRNFVAEMRAVIDGESGEGPYVSRLLAHEIVAKLHANDPELLFGWLMEQAEPMVWNAINSRDRSQRARHVPGRQRSVSPSAVEVSDNGDPGDALGEWLGLRYTVRDGSRRCLGDLRQMDLAYVAGTLATLVAGNQMNAAFLRALCARIGDSKVSDHFDDAQLAALWGSIARGA